jgi:hypothetical protein
MSGAAGVQRAAINSARIAFGRVRMADSCCGKSTSQHTAGHSGSDFAEQLDGSMDGFRFDSGNAAFNVPPEQHQDG